MKVLDCMMKEVKQMAGLERKGKFIRNGIMLHRQSMVPSQQQRIRELTGSERDREAERKDPECLGEFSL